MRIRSLDNMRIIVIALVLIGLAFSAPQIRASAGPAAQQAAEADPLPAPRQATTAVSAPQAGIPTVRRALRLQAILIQGNRRIKQKDILKYVRLSPGDTVGVDVLERARLDLLATDYFQEVDLSTQPGTERGSIVLNIEVVERKYPIVETGFGYHDLQGWFLTLIGLRVDHAFGVESQTRVGVRLGFHLAGIDAEWEKPATRTGDFGAGIRGHIYSQRHLFYGQGPQSAQNASNAQNSGSGQNAGSTQIKGGAQNGGAPQNQWIGSDWREFEQQINRAGAEATVHYRAGDATRFYFGLKVDKIEPDSSFSDIDEDKLERPFEELPAALKAGVKQTVLTGFVFRMIRDARNHSLYPTTGSFTRLTMEANTEFLGGDEIFTKATGDFRRHFHLGSGWVSSSRLSGGIVSSRAPYFERFYIGGNYSIRGFRELSLSPTDGDNGYWTASEEIRWPLIGSGDGPPRLTGLVFFDIGQGWRKGQSVTADDIEAAAGYGVRLRLPWIGTLGIDAGVPLTDGTTDDNFRVHGSLGFSF